MRDSLAAFASFAAFCSIPLPLWPDPRIPRDPRSIVSWIRHPPKSRVWFDCAIAESAGRRTGIS